MESLIGWQNPESLHAKSLLIEWIDKRHHPIRVPTYFSFCKKKKKFRKQFNSQKSKGNSKKWNKETRGIEGIVDSNTGYHQPITNVFRLLNGFHISDIPLVF